MTKLSEMRNIGKTLAQKMIEAGISSAEELISTGSKKAFPRLKVKDIGACFNMLCALEELSGGFAGMIWTVP